MFTRKTKLSKAKRLYEEAKSELEDGTAENAYYTAKEALNLAPDRADFHALAGKCAKNSGAIENAIRHFQDALSISSGNANWHRHLSKLFEQQGDFQAALREMETTLAIDQTISADSNHLDSYKRLSQLCRAAGNIEGEIAARREIVKSDRKGVKNLARLARLLFQEDKLSEAIPILESISADQEIPMDLFDPMVEFLVGHSSVNTAILILERQVKLRPDDTGILRRAARLQLRYGEAKRAKELLEILAEDPKAAPDILSELQHIEKCVQLGVSPNAERGSDWYDQVYAQSDDYRKHYKDSIYFKCWEIILDHIHEIQAREVFDVGCGPGQLAEMVSDLAPEVRYTGIDFSEEAVRMAKVACPKHEFRVGNALNPELYLGQKPDLILITEVLEHIEEDLDALKNMPANVRVLGSVPNFDSSSHVRFFHDEAEVIARYSHLFNDFHVDAIPLKADSKSLLYLFRGILKS